MIFKGRKVCFDEYKLRIVHTSSFRINLNSSWLLRYTERLCRCKLAHLWELDKAVSIGKVMIFGISVKNIPLNWWGNQDYQWLPLNTPIFQKYLYFLLFSPSWAKPERYAHLKHLYIAFKKMSQITPVCLAL